MRAWSPRARVVAGGAVGVAAAGVAISGPHPAGGQYGLPSLDPDYRGKLEGGETSRIRFDVVRSKGERVWVDFEAEDVRLACSDGTERFADFSRQTFHFENDRVFHGRYPEYANYPPDSGYGGSYRVRGKIQRPGKAKGLLQTTTRVPPEEGATCNTGGELRWRASRVR